MKKALFIALLLMIQCGWCMAQQYYSKTGRVVFISQAPLEKIESANSNAFIVFDVPTGNIELSVLIKGFQFAKALMQEHFNENYMESHLFPKGIFKGHVTNMKEVNLNANGTYTVNVTGNITLHGVTKPLSTTAKLTVLNGKVSVSSVFDLTVADFDIDIPKVVRDNIAKTVHVTVSADLQSMK